MDHPKVRRFARQLGLLICILASAVYAAVSIRSYAAYRLYKKLDYQATKRSVALEPSNAAYHGLLSKQQLVEASEPLDSLKQAKIATELDPYEARYWINLALAYHNLGHDEDAQIVTRRAISVDPTTPEILWTSGNMFLLESDPEEALNQFALLLQHAPRNAPRTLNLCWRIYGDVKTVERILPPNPDVYLDFLQILTTDHETDAAAQIWSTLMEQNSDFDFHRALFYVDYLIREHQGAQATEVWRTLSSKSKVLNQYTEKENLVSDSKLNQEILNAGFDWHYLSVPYVKLSLQKDPSSPSPDAHSLCITYDGANGNAGFYQTVPLESPGDYELSALATSENVQTANGPTIAVSDPYDESILASTERTSGTTEWHPLTAHFSATPQTKLVTVGIRRDPGGTIIKGRFCVQGISIRPDHGHETGSNSSGR